MWRREGENENQEKDAEIIGEKGEKKIKGGGKTRKGRI